MVSRKRSATLRRPGTAPAFSAIWAALRSGLRARVVAAWTLAKILLGCCEQVFALARPLGGMLSAKRRSTVSMSFRCPAGGDLEAEPPWPLLPARPVSPADLAVMRRIDELHLDHPFAGSRMLRDLLYCVWNMR